MRGTNESRRECQKARARHKGDVCFRRNLSHSSLCLAVSLSSRHSHLADAQEDGERALRTTSDRLQRDIEDLENRAESTRVLNAELREIALESHDARIAREVDDSDELESAQHERKVSVQLAISLAEEERLRRITEDENERLASTAEELDERHANQRAASAAVEEERRRRLLENPLGSPFATPARHKELTTEELEAEHRRANSLLAEQVEKEERALMIHVRRQMQMEYMKERATIASGSNWVPLMFAAFSCCSFSSSRSISTPIVWLFWRSRCLARSPNVWP